MNCRICGRELGREDDPLSLDCGGDCWGCIGEIEAEMGSESSLARVREEAAQGLRPSWKAPAEQPPSAKTSHSAEVLSRMKRFPFAAAPDVLVLTISTDAADLSREYFETEWGQSNEELCFCGGTLLGKIEHLSEASHLQVVLVPRLDRNRGYPWASVSAFADALWASRNGASVWTLRCEADADQLPVHDIADPRQVFEQIEIMLAFCMGQSNLCPTFSATSVAER